LTINVKLGDMVAAGETVMILESMKMEIPICAPIAGRVAQILVSEAASVSGDEVVATLDVD
jgi:biotin carboxyl carrier protein